MKVDSYVSEIEISILPCLWCTDLLFPLTFTALLIEASKIQLTGHPPRRGQAVFSNASCSDYPCSVVNHRNVYPCLSNIAYHEVIQLKHL